MTAVDAFVGFTGKLRLTELNDCMTIQISYDRLTYRALIDSGCDVNILFNDSTHGLTVPTNPLDGTLRGIGDVRAKISGSVRLSVNVGTLKMKESTFYILDSENEQYDCILGSEFLRANGFEIHPKENAVRIRDGDGYTLLSFSTSGELIEFSGINEEVWCSWISSSLRHRRMVPTWTNTWGSRGPPVPNKNVIGLIVLGLIAEV